MVNQWFAACGLSRDKWFLLVCAALFFAGVVFRLNGSSVFIWKSYLKDSGPSGGLLLSTPKDVRSDEWEVWTPALLSQARLDFPAENSSLGAGRTPLIYNLPVRDYTMCFRPQLWGFFIFDVERGYAWYWNAKIFGLIAAIFLLLRMLTGSFSLSLFGSLWLFFSHYVQWWFSCPPMLPEMLACWALALVAAVKIVRTARWTVRAGAIAVFIVAALDFILCLYPPFQIPLLYLGLGIFGAFFIQHRSGSRRDTLLGAAWLGAALLVIAALLIPFLIECRQTFEIIAATSYPGQRRTNGGGLAWTQLFSGLIDFFNSETRFPDRFGQANEAANFLPLWIPACLITARALFAAPRRHAVALALLALIALFQLYALCPLPPWFCSATLLGFCTEVRMLLGIGVAGILFVTITFPLLKKELSALKARTLLILIALLGSLVFLYLSASAPANPKFLTQSRIVLLLAINLALLIAFLNLPARFFQIGFVAFLAADTAFINPVMTGLAPLLQATPAAAVEKIIRSDPNGKWAVYENNVFSEFLMAMGAGVVTGVKVVPDLAFYRRLDPAGRCAAIYNRYAFSCFFMPRDRTVFDVRYLGFPAHVVVVHPANPALRAAGIRYFVFGRLLADPAVQGLELLAALPQNQMWIYKLLPES